MQWLAGHLSPEPAQSHQQAVEPIKRQQRPHSSSNQAFKSRTTSQYMTASIKSTTMPNYIQPRANYTKASPFGEHQSHPFNVGSDGLNTV